MENEKSMNEMSVYIIFDKRKRSQSEVVDFLNSFSVDKTNNVVVYIRKCFDKNNSFDDNRFICCMRKDFNDYLENNNVLNDSGLTIRRYRNKAEKLKPGLTHGFYINTKDISKQEVIEVFKLLEFKGFIRPNSYNIVHPKPYPGGNDRNYLIVTFERVNGFLPKNFIRKLRALLNQSQVNNKSLYINWLSYSVLRDIEKGSEKKQLVKTEAS